MKTAQKQSPMAVELKSFADLVDGLITACIKCALEQERIFNKKLSPNSRHAAAVRAHDANKRRCELMRAIDRRVGSKGGVLAKTF